MLYLNNIQTDIPEKKKDWMISTRLIFILSEWTHILYQQGRFSRVNQNTYHALSCQ
jgi:hypothetical protein